MYKRQGIIFADSGENFLEAFKISANSINLFLPSSFNPLIMLYGFSPKKDSYISSISSNWQSVRKTCKAGSRASVSYTHLKVAFTKLNSISGEEEGESVSQFFHILGSVDQQRG